MSAAQPLRFSCKERVRVHISKMPADRLVRHEQGTVLMSERGDAGRVLAARCRHTLPPAVQRRLVGKLNILFAERPFLCRGAGTACVCNTFQVIGFKADRMTGQALLHAGDRCKDAATRIASDTRFREILCEIQAVYLEFIHNIVLQSVGDIFLPVLTWLKDMQIELFCDQSTAATGGKGFVPRSHIDPDIWMTVLVRLCEGADIRAGGDFAFARAGWVLETRPGDVLIYDPLELHSTTEMHHRSAHDNCIYLAFYMKQSALDSRKASAEMKQSPWCCGSACHSETCART